jgi:hemerythrin-like domain-containing protein
VGAYGPLILVDHRVEHRQVDRLFCEAAEMGRRSTEKALEAVRFTRAHFEKEEKMLFTLARRALSREDLEGLATRTAEYAVRKGPRPGG